MLGSLKKALSEFADAVSTRGLSQREVEQALAELQDRLIQSDVPYDVSQSICNRLRERLSALKAKRFSDIESLTENTIRETLVEALRSVNHVDISQVVKSVVAEKGFCTVLFFGVNGSGKTTTIAKVAYRLKENGLKVMVAGADTFRAGAIEQLRMHAQRIGIAMFDGGYGADPASVAYGAIAEAKSSRFNVALIDTAGRMQTDADLMSQMQKISKVAKPDVKVFVGDGLVGNDALNQLRMFDKAVGIDGVVVTKLDADSRGGMVFSVTTELGKPVYAVGLGEGYDDLEPFDVDALVKKLF
ncbi:MAG: signal recognition particle-docking protein FtsY [Candidatus Marsarchaeota archaeon]|nr:signal recognition particle-docking protein FtsY [Candidatus Marsarchaeota archaeon]